MRSKDKKPWYKSIRKGPAGKGKYETRIMDKVGYDRKAEIKKAQDLIAEDDRFEM